MLQWQLKFFIMTAVQGTFIALLSLLRSAAQLWRYLLLRYILELVAQDHGQIAVWICNRHTGLIEINLLHVDAKVAHLVLLLLLFLHLECFLQMICFLELFQGDLKFLHNLHVFSLKHRWVDTIGHPNLGHVIHRELSILRHHRHLMWKSVRSIWIIVANHRWQDL